MERGNPHTSGMAHRSPSTSRSPRSTPPWATSTATPARSPTAPRARARGRREPGRLPRAGAHRLSARGPAAEDALPRRGGARRSRAGRPDERRSSRSSASPSAADDVYNAAAVLADGEVQAVYRKIHLPNYGVFDEQRYFQAGARAGAARAERRHARAHDLRGHLGARPAGDRPRRSPGAEVIVNLSASPYHAGKGVERERMLAQRARDSLACVLFCNAVGGQDELVFDGHSVASTRTASCSRARPSSRRRSCTARSTRTPSRPPGCATRATVPRCAPTRGEGGPACAPDGVAERRGRAARASSGGEVSPDCSGPRRRSTRRCAPACATTSTRTASSASCWRSPAASTPRWWP